MPHFTRSRPTVREGGGALKVCSIKTRGDARVVSVRDARASMRTAFFRGTRARHVFFPADVVSWLRERRDFLAGSGGGGRCFFPFLPLATPSLLSAGAFVVVVVVVVAFVSSFSSAVGLISSSISCVDVFKALVSSVEKSLFLFVNVPVCRSIFRFVAWNLFLMAFGERPGINLAKMAH